MRLSRQPSTSSRTRASSAASRSDASSGSRARTAPGPATAEGGEATILVVDDNEDCRVALRALLESLGHEVLEADDGESAVEVAGSAAPDLILMDIMMPGMDGLEATRKIRSLGEAGRGARIVAVSAMEGARQASLSAGCDDCIVKPIDLGRLDEMVAGWLGGD